MTTSGLTTRRQPTTDRGPGRTFRLAVLLAVAFVALIVVRGVGESLAPRDGASGPGADGSPSPAPPIDIAAYLEREVRPAPGLALIGPGGAPVSLAAMRGELVLVFFGYTHCPDVCPATIGTVGEAIAAGGPASRAILVSVDPERDTPEWMAEFVRYMPAGFTAGTDSPARIAAIAAAWGVRYARVDADDPKAYAMAHTADVFVVDAAGMLRARFPFGTDVATMVAVLDAIDASPVAPTVAPGTPAASAAPDPTATAITADLWPGLVSSSVWAGGASPVIFAVLDGDGRIDDPALTVTARLLEPGGGSRGPAVTATAVQPPGISAVSYVATLDIPSPGTWRLEIVVTDPAGASRLGVMDLTALDPGGTAALGAAAPAIRTPTAADFSGDLTRVTTDPLPDSRLSEISTTDALAARRPFVLVVDSWSFKVTPACGQAIVLAKRLLDRWQMVPFIHHEPYRYSVVTTQPSIEGSLAAPRLTDVADAWGVGSAPWGVTSMPWIFIVDSDGIVRAKYQGIVGSADVDVILALLAQEG